MNDDLFDAERVSCCMDGESTDYLDGITKDKKARACWCRYHLIRSAIREPQAFSLSEGFHDRVMQALDNEPTVLAPKLAGKRRHSLLKPIIKPVSGLAIAATVAAISVMGFQNLYAPPESSPILLSSNNPITPPSIKEVSQPNSMVSDKSEMILASDAVGEDLDAYLVGHMEQSVGGGNAHGMLPYVRLAGYDEN